MFTIACMHLTSRDNLQPFRAFHNESYFILIFIAATNDAPRHHQQLTQSLYTPVEALNHFSTSAQCYRSTRVLAKKIDDSSPIACCVLRPENVVLVKVSHIRMKSFMCFVRF